VAIAEVLGAGGLLLVLLAGLVTFPRWYARSLHRYRLWRLRDSIVDQIIDGSLPHPDKNPAVKQLLTRTQTAITNTARFTILDGVILVRLSHGLSREAQERLTARFALCSTDGLDKQQCEVITNYRNELDVICGGTLLLGSWLGLLTVIAFFPKVHRARQGSFRQAAAAATDEATASTRIGRKAREAAEEKLDLGVALRQRQGDLALVS
jgi:hypothetical protein